MIVCELDKKTSNFNFGEKTLNFVFNLSLLSRGAVGVLFSTIWNNIYWFLMAISGSKCLVDIWKRMHKKSEASDALSSWCFFGLNEVNFFLMFAVCFLMFDKSFGTQSA